MDIFTLLKTDHAKVKKLLTEAVNKEELDEDLVTQICDELELHMAMEESVLYPKLMKDIEDKDVAEEADLEHQEAKALMAGLKNKRYKEIKRKVKLEMLKLAIEHHVEEEESEMFDQIRDAYSADEITEIGNKMTEYKESHKKATV